jgi:hypothetical protein
MAATVLHFGPDKCKRVLVLRSAGYSVDVCLSLTEFRSALKERAETHAVLVTERPGKERHEVVIFTREYSHAGLVLFDNTYDGAEEGEFDLIIPPQMAPEDWLRGIAAVIERSRVLTARSTAIREQSAQLKKDSEIVDDNPYLSAKGQTGSEPRQSG